MGNATQKLAPEDISALNGMEDVTGMDRKELMKEYKKFKKQYPTGGISKEAFRKLADQFLPPQQRTGDFINRLFNAFDADKSGEIDFREFLIAMNYALSDQPDEKIAFYFKTLDLDNSGFLEEKEVRYAVELIFKHNPGLEQRVGPDINSPEKVVQQIFKIVDSNEDGKLSCQELIEFMHSDPKKFSYLGLNLIFLP